MSNNLEQQGDGGGETVLCPVCGVENPANAEVCIDCNFTFGEDMDASGNEQTQEPQAELGSEESDENIICGGCGAELPVDTTSCFICNEDLNALEEDISEGMTEPAEEQDSLLSAEAGTAAASSDGIACNNCGAELPGDTVSCIICGEDVNVLDEDISEGTPGQGEMPDSLLSAEMDSESPQDTPDSEESDENWDLGVVGGDETPEEPGEAVDTDLDDDLPPVDELEEIEEQDLPDEEPEPADELPVLGSNEFHCPSCSKAIPMGNTKCPECWADLPELIRCPQCDVAIPLESDACPECFVKLEDGVLIEDSEKLPVEAVAVIDEFDEVDEDLMPQEEVTDELFEETTEVYGVECPFCRAIANVSDDICSECGMPLIEEEEQPKRRNGHLKYQKPERDWYRIIAFGLIIVLLFSAVIPFAIPLPHVDREQIRIDGTFGDWNIITTHNDSLSDASNANIDIIDYKMVSDAFNIYFYVQVAGTAFGDSEGDTSRIFIDLDQNSSTGYSVMGIGADYQIRVFGHGGLVESSSCLQFDSTRAHNDFNGFESFCPSVPHTADTLDDNDKFEVRVTLEDLGIESSQPVTAVYYMGDTSGNSDYSDTPLSNTGSLLFISQTSVVPADGILSGSSADVLSLELMAIGNELAIADVAVPNCDETFTSVMGNGDVQFVNLTTSTTGLSSGTFVHRQALPEHFDVPDTHVVVIGSGAYAYANAAPATIEIDGAFADWAGKGMTFSDSPDDQTMKNGIDANDDAGLDLLDQTTVIENNNLNILVNSDGDMLAGMWVPEIEESYADTQPNTRAGDTTQPSSDYTYSQPRVDRTRAPNLHRPTTKPEKTGEGAVKVFIDTDNDPATGYVIGGIGADYLVEAFGQEGQVTRTGISTFTAGADRNVQNWAIITSTIPDGASSGSNIEISIPLSAFGTGMNNNATAVIQLVDWNLNGDVSDLTAWDIFETGTRSSTRNINPGPGVVGKIALADGLTYADGATVIMKSPSSHIHTDTSYVPLGGAINNYHINQGFGFGDDVRLYSFNNSSRWGYAETTYPAIDAINPTSKNIVMDNNMFSISPQNLTVTNLGLGPSGIKAVEINWTHGSDPVSYNIYKTNRTTSYGEYSGVGRFYSYTADRVNVAGSTTSYQDSNAVENQTNYYIIEAVDSSFNYNYSTEVSVMADYYEPEMEHNTFSESYSSLVRINATINDGAGVNSATFHYRKGTSGAWALGSMSLMSGGTPQSGVWEGWMPVDTSSRGVNYQYYLTSNDGTFNSVYGAGGPGDPTPMNFNVSSPGDDPYPIYGYVKWGDGSLVGAGVDVYVQWMNKSGPWVSSILNDPNPGMFPFTTNAASQYSIDMLDYDPNSQIYANATIGGLWGYNQTIPNFPFDGGKMVNITLEAPSLDITKTAPAFANPGDNITYTVIVNSSGNTTAYNVNITDILPADVTVLSAVPGESGNASNTYFWNIGNLAPGESFWINITVQINQTILIGSIVTNDVNATWTNSIDSYWGVVSDNTTTLTGEARLNITKWAPAFANPGELITYWINYTNTGTQTAYNVNIIENYPLSGVSFDSSIPAPTVGNNFWNIGDLNAGVSDSIEIRVRVGLGVAGQQMNTVNISATGLATVWAFANTTVRNPMIEITKTAPQYANTGEVINYTIYYLNNGTDVAYNIWINDTLPSDVNFTGSSIPWDYNLGQEFGWDLGDLAPGMSGSINISVNVNTNASGTFTNWAFAECEDAAGQTIGPVSSFADTMIMDPNVTIQKTANVTVVVPGGFILYNITYENLGTGNATNVTITDLYPTDVAYVWALPLPTIGTDTWVIADIPANTTGWINILVQVDINATLGTIIINEANMTYQNQANTNMTGMIDSAITAVIGPTMAIQKSGPVSASVGEIFNYTILYTNTGTNQAYNVFINDTIPSDIMVLMANPTPISTLLGYYVWDIGAVAPGASGTIQLTVMGTVAGTRINNATLNYENAAGISLPEIYSDVSTEILAVPITGPPEVTTTPPEFVFASQNFTLYALVTDHETGIDTVILYWTDIYGVQSSSVMVPLVIDANNGNGIYQYQIPPQPYKGFVSYSVWVNDTDGNANRTGTYDIPVRLPPYFVWGYIFSADGTPVNNGMVQVTDLETNETVIAMTDITGYYRVDLSTLYSGYLNGEEISVFATDGLYYGTNGSYSIDLDFMSDNSMNWPNMQINIVLSEIPEFTMILTPIIGILILVLFMRINRRREEDEYKK